MAVVSRTFWLPRRGNNPAEYEDAFAGQRCVRAATPWPTALAKGAYRLMGQTAGRRLRGPCRSCLEAWPRSLSAVQEQWDTDVRGRKLPYHAEPWVRQGAYAAFLGLVLHDSPRPAGEGQGVGANAADSPYLQDEGEGDSFHWQAMAVGDTCLFHTRDVRCSAPFRWNTRTNSAMLPSSSALAWRRKRLASAALVARRLRAAGRSSLGDDRCLGAMVPGRA